MRRRRLLTLALVLSSCGGGTSRTPAKSSQPAASSPPAVSSGPRAARSARFDYVGQSWLRFEATVADYPTRLMFDTGGGITILSEDLCKRVGCVPDGTHSGKRMSGQELQVKMVRVPSLVVAGHRVVNARVGTLDMRSLLHPDLGIEGVAALDLFRDQPFTIDYTSREMVLETDESLVARRKNGHTVKVRVEHDGPSTELYLPLELSPGAPPLEMEVDTGSRSLVLNQPFMAALGIQESSAGVKRIEGRDETEHAYVRFFGTLPRALHVAGASDVTVPAQATVMFQKIIHDGLVGHSFLSAYTTTYDLARGNMIFALPR